jgi:hypothetical protein
MARNERVTYECDVCGQRGDAMELRPMTGQPFYTRPAGWGAMSGVISLHGSGRVKRKWDFCSEHCARQAFEEMMDDAYSADDPANAPLHEQGRGAR